MFYIILALPLRKVSKFGKRLFRDLVSQVSFAYRTAPPWLCTVEQADCRKLSFCTTSLVEDRQTRDATMDAQRC